MNAGEKKLRTRRPVTAVSLPRPSPCCPRQCRGNPPSPSSGTNRHGAIGRRLSCGSAGPPPPGGGGGGGAPGGGGAGGGGAGAGAAGREPHPLPLRSKHALTRGAHMLSRRK